MKLNHVTTNRYQVGSANPFLHRPFFFSTGLIPRTLGLGPLSFYSAQRLDLFA